uniref:Uncharacterized protein n=1 Tax=viral metagenome TaxID=1070528 RepID=A0A6C0JJM2_9ZZZZ
MSRINVHEILSEDIKDLKTCINSIRESFGKIDNLYVSVGGKHNEQYITFNNPFSIKTKIFRTNSDYQLVPNFLQFNPLNKKTLIIAIDNFSNEETRRINKQILERNIDENMHAILFNKICTKSFLETFAEYFIVLCEENDIEPSDAMICNYVRFANNPNPIELIAEQIIPETLQNSLNNSSNTKYCECFYQWFGYRYYIYNFIFKYKKHYTYDIFNYARILEQFIENNDERLLKRGFVEFLDNICDIMSLYKKIELNDYV